MNSLDRKFKDMLQDRINESFLDAQMSLAIPATNEISTNIHEIGLLRGYMKSHREIYDICDEIMKQLTEPEKILEKKA